jgi:hypothetical protein
MGYLTFLNTFTSLTGKFFLSPQSIKTLQGSQGVEEKGEGRGEEGNNEPIIVCTYE